MSRKQFWGCERRETKWKHSVFENTFEWNCLLVTNLENTSKSFSGSKWLEQSWPTTYNQILKNNKITDFVPRSSTRCYLSQGFKKHQKVKFWTSSWTRRKKDSLPVIWNLVAFSEVFLVICCFCSGKFTVCMLTKLLELENQLFTTVMCFRSCSR